MSPDGIALDPAAEADRRQRLAADPAVSAAVMASAGSGKTKLLTDRLLRLMLCGAAPERILCLTYTRAAAAEMANRLRARLARWAVMDDAALDRELATLTGAPPADADRVLARSLMARVLDAPGGLRIETLHALAQSLLRRFPLEAGVAPQFTLLEERDARQELNRARDAVLVEAMEGEPALREATAVLAREAGPDAVGMLLGAILPRAQRLTDAQCVIDAQRAILGFPADEEPDEERLLRNAVDGGVAEDELARAASALKLGRPTDCRWGTILATWLAGLPEQRVARWPMLTKLFLTDKGEPRKKLVTVDLARGQPWLPGAMQTQQDHVLAVEARRSRIRLAVASAALVRLAVPIAARLREAKERRGLLDYDDLIEKARALLIPGRVPWVLYKLDGGLDHLLIDEAQDTAPAQWAIASALAAEFHAGEGASQGRMPRTVFAVGDVKQSIYSFQGAEPRAFVEARDRFASQAKAAGQAFRIESLPVSFRSTAAVLDLVDAVFESDPTALTLGEGWEAHRPSRTGEAGSVELWPLAPRTKLPEADPWDPPAPADQPEAQARLASALAGRIASMLVEREVLPAKGRPIRPGDILVLVRRRGSFVDALVRALKALQVPVAGADRLTLASTLAVQDLVAFAHVLLLPEDDLTLATVLKGPFCRLSEDDLFELAHGREGRRLWRCLVERGAERPSWEAARLRIERFRSRADQVTPHALFAELLGEDRGRRDVIANLGEEAAEPVDEFLELALAHEATHPPSLQGFLAWLGEGGSEIKRETEAGQDSVRIMTVHGAKGLQAPIVVLPDTTAVPGRDDPVLWHNDTVPFWAPRREARGPEFDALLDLERAADAAERRRLLYVALTRAEDRLIVCGAAVRGNTPNAASWYEEVKAGLARLGERVGRHDFDSTPWAGASGWQEAGGLWIHASGIPRAAVDTAEQVRRHAPRLPGWWGAGPSAEPVPPRPLAPSEPEPTDQGPTAAPGGRHDPKGARFRRGLVLHALLQHLPSLPERSRRVAARRYLNSSSLHLPHAEAEALVDETLAVLAHPELGPLFGPGALAEAPISGLVGNRPVAGRVDRLAVTADTVWFCDFKTNRPPPATVARVPVGVLRQMGAYRSLLSLAFPGRTVRAALVWTYAAAVMTLPDALLDQAIEGWVDGSIDGSGANGSAGRLAADAVPDA